MQTHSDLNDDEAQSVPSTSTADHLTPPVAYAGELSPDADPIPWDSEPQFPTAPASETTPPWRSPTGNETEFPYGRGIEMSDNGTHFHTPGDPHWFADGQGRSPWRSVQHHAGPPGFSPLPAAPSTPSTAVPGNLQPSTINAGEDAPAAPASADSSPPEDILVIMSSKKRRRRDGPPGPQDPSATSAKSYDGVGPAKPTGQGRHKVVLSAPTTQQ